MNNEVGLKYLDEDQTQDSQKINKKKPERKVKKKINKNSQHLAWLLDQHLTER